MYEIAYHLRIPVYVLINEMPHEELLKWCAFFSERPVGWREDDRTAKIMQSFGGKFDATKVFPSLAVIANARHKGNDFDVSGFMQSALFQQLAKAEGGLNILEITNEG